MTPLFTAMSRLSVRSPHPSDAGRFCGVLVAWRCSEVDAEKAKAILIGLFNSLDMKATFVNDPGSGVGLAAQEEAAAEMLNDLVTKDDGRWLDAVRRGGGQVSG